jgi:hypothetical protein
MLEDMVWDQMSARLVQYKEWAWDNMGARMM